MGAAGTSWIHHSGFSGRIGVARFDITPPVGIYSRMWGAARHETAEGIHRPLTGTALVFAGLHTEEMLAFVTLDLGWWRAAEEEWFVRGHVLNSLGLQPHQLVIALTHTHAGPSISLAHADRPGGQLIEPYLNKLRGAIVTAIEDARASATNASLTWATGRCSLARNRHYRSRGSGQPVVGCNPRVPADDTLLVGRVTAESGRIVATIVNYACHLTTLGPANRLLSPDFGGAMREIVEAHTAGAPCAFLQGAAGELAPLRQYADDTSLADQNGRTLGYAVLSTLESMLPHNTSYRYSGVMESGASLGIWTYADCEPSGRMEAKSIIVELPLKRSAPVVRVAEAEDDFQRRVLIERFDRAHHLQQLLDNKSALKMPVWIWRLGDSYVVGVPAECYSDLQIMLRARFPENAIAVLNLANGYYGYVPALSDYQHQNYESNTYEVQVSLLAAGCLETLTEAVERAISAMSCSTLNGVPAAQLAALENGAPSGHS